jgi:uncharacterized membrane protein
MPQELQTIPAEERASQRRTTPMPHDPYDASWKERLAVLGTGFGIFFVALVLGLVYAHDATTELLGIVPVSMVAVGKFLPMWGITGQSNFNPWELGLVIWLLDTCTVLVVVYGLEGVYRFAYLRRTIDKVRSNVSLVLVAYPRIRKGAIIGVMLFVLFPIAGTGAMIGSFLGILLGLHRHVLIAAVSVGGLIGGMFMAVLAVYFSETLIWIRDMQQHAVVKYTSIAFMVLIIVLAFRWLGNTYKRALAAAAEQVDRAPAED